MADVSRTPDSPGQGAREEVQPFRPRPRNDFLTSEDVAAGLRWSTVERNRGDSDAADRILSQLHHSAIRTWGVGHRQLAPIEAEMLRWNVRPALDSSSTTVRSVSPVTDDMVERVVGGALDEWRRHQDHAACAEYSVGKHPTFERIVSNALSAALAGCTVVALPETDADASYEGDRKWTNRNGDYVFAYHDSNAGPIVDLSNGERVGPESAEEDAAILLAAAREARRLAGGSQVGDQHGD